MSDITIDKLKELATGNREIINELYLKVYPKIKSYVMKNNGFSEDAEDIFQKVLIQVITRYNTNPFEISSSLDGFLYVAACNLWKRELNKRKRVVTNEKVIELVSEDEDIVMASLEQEKWEFFQEKLNSISDNCKDLLKLFFKKVPYKEIVTQLGYKTDNVVRQRIFNCKSQLTKAIQNDVRFKEFI
ncbi:RNA polymerase sigma factor (sigma-70 family) [Tenacibaculum skagerrakense]|uniref:RNA polymerase sigma factor (Sigma-70 family) n=1 Tax=Tenacibaculum skagerrakense TaxID=186571 RepID=A0A4R2NKN7_9FLAO|nr:sigma-70 family RNA polymerase sigma factor [Tenacibaculum skagerrakense]TCP21744.1 RNA polymerase sigma factor (sigma-70 family) [Tenacibaculum skagerrakense]